MPTTRYDIVGCGAVVEQRHAPVLNALRQATDLSIAGCYDRNPEAAGRLAATVEAERWGERSSPSEGDGVDAVLIATPPSSHAEIAADYIGAGKSVFLEKPITRTPEEARQLVEAAEQRPVRAAVNQFWRFSPSANIARRWLHDKLDRIDSITASEGVRLEWSPSSNYLIEDPYGGVVHDFGTHVLDLVLYLLGFDQGDGGVSVEVHGVTKDPPQEPSHECRARLALSGPGTERIAVDLKVSRLQPLPRGVTVRGSFGVLFVPAECAPSPILFQGEDGFRLSSAENELEPADLGGCFLLAHQEFLDALHDRTTRTRIDAGRFLLLTEILESLRAEGGS